MSASQQQRPFSSGSATNHQRNAPSTNRQTSSASQQQPPPPLEVLERLHYRTLQAACLNGGAAPSADLTHLGLTVEDWSACYSEGTGCRAIIISRIRDKVAALYNMKSPAAAATAAVAPSAPSTPKPAIVHSPGGGDETTENLTVHEDDDVSTPTSQQPGRLPVSSSLMFQSRSPPAISATSQHQAQPAFSQPPPLSQRLLAAGVSVAASVGSGGKVTPPSHTTVAVSKQHQPFVAAPPIRGSGAAKATTTSPPLVVGQQAPGGPSKNKKQASQLSSVVGRSAVAGTPSPSTGTVSQPRSSAASSTASTVLRQRQQRAPERAGPQSGGETGGGPKGAPSVTTTGIRCPPQADDSVGLSACGTLMERFIIVTGGVLRDTNVVSASIDCYDTVMNQWLPQLPGGAGSITALPEPLYGHCCVTHGQRSVWLIGGLNGAGGVSKTIIRLTITIQFMLDPIHPTAAPAAPPLSMAVGGATSTCVIPGGVHLSGVAVGYTVSAMRTYLLPFPVAMASCVKLQGVLSPVALVIGGLSTVRDTDCGGGLETTTHSKTQTTRQCDDNKVAVPLSQRGTVAQDPDDDMGIEDDMNVRRLGMTNRSFALDLVDCCIFRVAQVATTAESIPTPRIMAAAAPILRRDVSGSYGSVLYFGGVDTMSIPPPHRGSDSLAGAAAKPPVLRHHHASVVSSPELHAVYVASVSHDPKSKTFSLKWSRCERRSAAEPWPRPAVCHSLCSIHAGVVVVLGGTPLPTDNESDAERINDVGTTPGGASKGTATTAMSEGTVMGILYDAVTGVSCSEVTVKQRASPSSAKNSSAIGPGGISTKGPLSRFVVVRPALDDPPTTQTDNSDLRLSPSASITPLHPNAEAVERLPLVDELPIYVIDGGKRHVETLVIPLASKVMAATRSDSDEGDAPEVHISAEIELFRVSARPRSTTTNGPNAAAAVQLTWEGSLLRNHVNVDTLVASVAEFLVSKLDPNTLKRYKDAQGLLSDVDAMARNLILYGVGSESERVPLSNDAVLHRMIARCGLNTLPLHVCVFTPIRSFMCLARLGEGSFGKVYSAVDQDTGQNFAIKRVLFAPEQRGALLREIRLLRSLDHPNIVRYLGVEVNPTKHKANIFMEYVKIDGCADLISFLKRLKVPTMSIIRYHLRQVVAALAYLHSYHIVHQDIKGANVLVSVEYTKLADFGTARQLVADDGDGDRDVTLHSGGEGVQQGGTCSSGASAAVANKRETREGTAVFMAPEVLLGGADDVMATSSDIWSLGCLLIEMATCELPWQKQLSGTAPEAFFQLLNKLRAGAIPPYPTRKDFPPSGVAFLDDCLVHDPKKRKTAAELMNHPFLLDDLDEDNNSYCCISAPAVTAPPVVPSAPPILNVNNKAHPTPIKVPRSDDPLVRSPYSMGAVADHTVPQFSLEGRQPSELFAQDDDDDLGRPLGEMKHPSQGRQNHKQGEDTLEGLVESFVELRPATTPAAAPAAPPAPTGKRAGRPSVMIR